MFFREDIPWNEIAFTSTKHALELFFADPEKTVRGQGQLHSLDLKELFYPM
jgi:hypothetical protein